ncbi:HtaA domain-containing protein [Corynebacterium timonense]|uniref:Htaa protein n=1 Tax=Corynebacterium timonense TaxID=441500 RepID=A0A1H1QNK4_9CORY|nr:HtaA domain-containing protein [Corynebacterium timonense]SDS25061.1 Htaa protein [Corynebacterium timonense]
MGPFTRKAAVSTALAVALAVGHVTPASGTESTTHTDAVASTSTQDQAAPIAAAYANWDFRRSFRDYVGTTLVGDEGETRTQVDLLEHSRSLMWKVRPGQSINVASPRGKLHFDGAVAWYKYGGILNVRISNPTIDFDNELLLVDGYTTGTMAKEGVVEFTQEPIARLNGLTVETRDGYSVISSLEPTLMGRVKDLVGFYDNEGGEPLVVTLTTDDDRADTLLRPQLWDVFPTRFRNPRTGPAETDAPLTNVDIADARLEACIRSQADIAPNVPMTNKALEGLEALSCPKLGITHLQGLEHAVNLASVNLRGNKLRDIAPLRQAKRLVVVDVSENELTSIAELSGATALQQLRAEQNWLHDVSVVTEFSALDVLDVSHNRISNLEHVTWQPEETMSTLDLSHNRIGDLSKAKDLPFARTVDLSYNLIETLGTLPQKRAIERLNLEHNFITDLDRLSDWAEGYQRRTVKALTLGYNSFTNWDALRGLTAVDTTRGDTVNAFPDFERFAADPQAFLNPMTIDERHSRIGAEDRAIDAAMQKPTKDGETTAPGKEPDQGQGGGQAQEQGEHDKPRSGSSRHLTLGLSIGIPAFLLVILGLAAQLNVLGLTPLLNGLTSSLSALRAGA